MSTTLREAELILNQVGRIYHLDLAPHEISDTIFLVGDPARVPLVSQHFDRIEMMRQHREFITHTGYVGKQRLSVVSTGISTANIDIVLNELDCLVNVDLNARQIKPELTHLNIIRLGTAGSLQPDVGLDSFVATNFALNLGSLLCFYPKQYTEEEKAIQKAFHHHTQLQHFSISPMVTSCDPFWLNTFAPDCHVGMTVTCPGFYAPQGRCLRLPEVVPDIISMLASFRYNDHSICNLEMETGAIYGLGRALAHRCISLSAILAHRISGHFSVDPNKTVERLITMAIEKTVTALSVTNEIEQF